MPPKRAKKSKENTSYESDAILTSIEEIQAFIKKNLKNGGADIDVWKSAIEDLEEDNQIEDLREFMLDRYESDPKIARS